MQIAGAATTQQSLSLLEGLARGRTRQLMVLAALTLALHLPFIFQPVQGDEVNYLDMAREALKHPLAPLDFRYVFQGQVVDMAGHPHPPLNVFILALLWLIRGQVSVVFFHAAYLVFPLLIAYAGYLLAERFTERPFWAALLLSASPLIQVNTNTLAGAEAPAIAFLLLGCAFFIRSRFVAAGVTLALAGLTALQALAVIALLPLFYLLRRERPPRAAWIAVAAPFVVFGAWQAAQFVLTGRIPLAVMAGYATGSAYGRLSLKLKSVVALVQHVGILIIFAPLAGFRRLPLAAGLLAGGGLAAYVSGYAWWERVLLVAFVTAGVQALAWLWEARRDEPFLAAWSLLYFAFACIAFFAGAARYLLPLAAPVVLLFVRRFSNDSRRLAAALAVSLFLGLNISFAAYEFAWAYPQVPPPPSAPFLVNGEWGFRYYMEQRGGKPLEQHSRPAAPGEWIVASELSLATNYDSVAEAAALPIRTLDLYVRSPLRLVDRYARTGFSSTAFGLLPFSFSTRPLDRIHYYRTSPFLYLAVPWTPTQFSGRLVYLPEPGAVVRLPLQPGWQTLRFRLYATAPGAVFIVRSAEGRELFREEMKPGSVWAPRSVGVSGMSEVLLTIEAPPGVRAGWGELTAE